MEAPSYHMNGATTRMTGAAYDQVTKMDAEHYDQKAPQSAEEEWQRILERVNAGDNDNSHDLTMLSPQAGAMTLFDQSPRQSIETLTAMDVEPIVFNSNSNSSSSSSLYPYLPLEAEHEQWPTTSAPPFGFSSAIPEHEAWSAPPVSSYAPMMPTGLSAHVHMHQSPFYHPNEMQPYSPMLSQGSPHDPDYVEDAYGQRDYSQPWPNSGSSDEIDDPYLVEVCYAQLLWRCLKEAPEHTMALKELYDWVREHSQKAKDPKNRGWQNSVRHNLSMNAAFERVQPRETASKKSSLWRLTPAALRDGVISTTRYRKDPKHKPVKRATPALKRQISGAKGGQATRNAQRRQQQLREARSFPNLSSRQHHNLRHPPRHSPGMMSPVPYFSTQHAMPHPFHPAHQSPYFDVEEQMSPMPRSAPLTPPRVQMMYETQPKSLMTDFNFGHIDFTNGAIIGEHDDFTPDTPSLATEASYMSDDGVQSLMSHNASREPTSFPADV